MQSASDQHATTLRERIARVLWEGMWRRYESAHGSIPRVGWESVTQWTRDQHLETADEVLREINNG